MKLKTLLSIVLICLSMIGAKAQTEKGNIMVGGSTGGLNIAAGDSSSQLSFNLNPQVGYFVTNHFAVGTRLGFSHSFTRRNGINQYRSSSMAVGIFVRYYVPLTARIMIPYELELGGGFGYWHTPTAESDFSSAFLGFASGLSFFLNESVGIELLLYYRLDNQINPVTSGVHGTLVGRLGFNIFLDPKGGAE